MIVKDNVWSKLHQPVYKLQFFAEDVIGIDKLHGALFDGQSRKSETVLLVHVNTH